MTTHEQQELSDLRRMLQDKDAEISALRTELIRMTQLGLWAEKYGASALDTYSRMITQRVDINTSPLSIREIDCGGIAREALAALPKEGVSHG